MALWQPAPGLRCCDTLEGLIRRILSGFALFALTLSIPVVAQEEEFRVYTESPRLFLRSQRLRLLKREKQRESLRWMQFENLVLGRTAMAEGGFAFALLSQVLEKPEYCQEAVKQAGEDLRQLSIVFDWCDAQPLAGSIREKADALGSVRDISSMRSRALAAIALSEKEPDWSESVLKDVVQRWWRHEMVPAIREGKPVPREDFYALFELLHAVKDNLNIDLRDPVQGFFRDLPVFHMISHYPASYPGAENEFRIPYYQHDGEPDLKIAALSRAAELAMVAFDSNPVESQAMQSWLLQDRYLMRGPFGVVYEFLWANPYQPGITYHFLPNVFHDRRSGRLFIRSSWEEDATFFCYDKKIGQVFEAGKRADVNVLEQTKPVRIGAATIVAARLPLQFDAGYTLDQPKDDGEKTVEETWFLVGLQPGSPYSVEPEDQEMNEMISDAGGIISLSFPRPRKMQIRVQEPLVPEATSQK